MANCLASISMIIAVVFQVCACCHNEGWWFSKHWNESLQPYIHLLGLALDILSLLMIAICRLCDEKDSCCSDIRVSSGIGTSGVVKGVGSFASLLYNVPSSATPCCVLSGLSALCSAVACCCYNDNGRQKSLLPK